MGQVLFAPALAGCTSDDVTASAAQVLSGYTALTKDSNDDPISGTMTNRGAWTSSSSGSGRITVPAGYHNGSGYVDCSGAYNAGVTAADARANSSSTNYKSGYNSGYSAGRSQGQADVKANPGSYGLESGGSYQNGYNAGRSQGQADVKANPGSYGLEAGGSYSNGYNAGYSAGHSSISSVKVNIYVSGEDGGHDVKGSNKTITYGQTGDFSDASGHGYHFRVISWSS